MAAWTVFGGDPDARRRAIENGIGPTAQIRQTGGVEASLGLFRITPLLVKGCASSLSREAAGKQGCAVIGRETGDCGSCRSHTTWIRFFLLAYGIQGVPRVIANGLAERAPGWATNLEGAG